MEVEGEASATDIYRTIVLRGSYSFKTAGTVLTTLLKHGFVTLSSDSEVCFSSPIITYLASTMIYENFKVGCEGDEPNFVRFIFLTLQRLNPDVLSESLGTDKEGTLYERTWQMEFYRAASSCLLANTCLSPDVGHCFGSTGFLDFYVNGDKQWGIELTREGSKLDE
jgi:hypothetical protein